MTPPTEWKVFTRYSISIKIEITSRLTSKLLVYSVNRIIGNNSNWEVLHGVSWVFMGTHIFLYLIPQIDLINLYVFKTQNLSLSTPQLATRPIQARIMKFRPEIENTLSFSLFLGWLTLTFKVKVKFKMKIYSNLRLSAPQVIARSKLGWPNF